MTIHTTESTTSTVAPAEAVVDLDAIAHNVRLLRERAGRRRADFAVRVERIDNRLCPRRKHSGARIAAIVEVNATERVQRLVKDEADAPPFPQSPPDDDIERRP